MSDRKITIKDIALKAKVSTGTVDRVIHKRGRVSPKVAERVLKILEEMDYEPNFIARALGSKKTFEVAALIPDDQYDTYWKDPREGIKRAERELKQYGVVVKFFLFDPYDVKSFVEQARQLNNSEPDGIIVSPIFYREVLPFFKTWQDKKIPFVLFNTQIADIYPLCYVGQDAYQSGMLAARLVHSSLPDNGTVLIAHFDEDISNAFHMSKKEQGFRNYFVQNDLEEYDLLKEELNSSNYSLFKAQMDKVIEHNSNLKAIYVTTSKAYQVAGYLKERRINGIKIIGYDLLPKNVNFLQSGLITFLINQNARGQGFWSLQLISEYLVLKKEIPMMKYLPLDIIVKENLNYFLGEDTDFLNIN
ncbi:substrate-binding domain-containing protein [Mucilaginibacter mali]|uniref:Substrate-binding domain-containing protein n=1 Tax=Mucilaginibacter mali TaxID=2740462 RepID=A0A7D4TY79_9SPHI|nr:substrate-binding domain-containing protein [Mucilaginibacter mali]QKJ31097.1 substrate-binding domain-containing protein [Mucilaginibacter mali]